MGHPLHWRADRLRPRVYGRAGRRRQPRRGGQYDRLPAPQGDADRHGAGDARRLRAAHYGYRGVSPADHDAELARRAPASQRYRGPAAGARLGRSVGPVHALESHGGRAQDCPALSHTASGKRYHSSAARPHAARHRDPRRGKVQYSRCRGLDVALAKFFGDECACFLAGRGGEQQRLPVQCAGRADSAVSSDYSGDAAVHHADQRGRCAGADPATAVCQAYRQLLSLRSATGERRNRPCRWARSCARIWSRGRAGRSARCPRE